MGAVEREVLRDEVSLPDEVVLIDSYGPEVMIDDGQDALQAFAPLGTGGVIDHVHGNEIVERTVVT
jgi:hypothetical protein